MEKDLQSFANLLSSLYRDYAAQFAAKGISFNSTIRTYHSEEKVTLGLNVWLISEGHCKFSDGSQDTRYYTHSEWYDWDACDYGRSTRDFLDKCLAEVPEDNYYDDIVVSYVNPNKE